MKFNKKINIGNKLVSNNSPTFVIAEAGVNHGGDINIAKQLIDVAVNAKADAVKFQTFKAERSILKNVKKAPYQKETTAASESQFDMLKKLEINKHQHHLLKKYCNDKNIIFLTTPFDEQSLDELDELDLPAYKVSSSDTTNIPLLIKIAKKRKPMLLSTGMSYLSEVTLALQTIYQYNNSVVLLHCTANYPMEDNEANLAVLNTFRDNFDILVGYSDHSIGIGVAPFTIPMGARVVEKHFTIDKNDFGPDHLASLSPDELVEFVKVIRNVDKYIGSNIKEPTTSELSTRKSLQKCLVANCNIQKGESFSEDNIVAKRTGGIGISPIFYKEIIGMKAKKNFSTNDIIEK
tara:strand:- start:35867 stop:36913 length:1047 start_codon:yes stop_codon:yes gene_type:complete